MSLNEDMECIEYDIRKAIESEVSRRTAEISRMAEIGKGVKISARGAGKSRLQIVMTGHDGCAIDRKDLSGLIWENPIFGMDCVALDNTTDSAANECRAMIAGLRNCISVLEDRLEYILSLKQ